MTTRLDVIVIMVFYKWIPELEAGSAAAAAAFDLSEYLMILPFRSIIVVVVVFFFFWNMIKETERRRRRRRRRRDDRQKPEPHEGELGQEEDVCSVNRDDEEKRTCG